MMGKVLRAFLLLLGFCLLAGATACPVTRESTHILNRTAFGPGGWSSPRINTLGIDGYLEEQLHPARIDDTACAARVADLEVLALDYPELKSRYCKYCDPPQREVVRQLLEAKLTRDVHCRRQLEQVLVDFWFDHFNVDSRRREGVWAVAPFERDAIRPHVLGRFSDMLLAVAKSPAMLSYLDNAVSFRDGFERSGRTLGLNTNYARELMELHTVGADGGFNETDVREAARALSGWSIDDAGFVFVADGHDTGAKRVMDLSIPPGGGEADGEQLLNYLAGLPQTARRISSLLVRRFVSEDPQEALVSAAADSFMRTGGDLREVMRVILFSTEFRDPTNHGSKVKSPWFWVASAYRELGLDARLGIFPLSNLRQMGNVPYRAAPPTGVPDDSKHWASPDGFLVRVSLSNSLGRRARRMQPPMGSSIASRVRELIGTLSSPSPNASLILLVTTFSGASFAQGESLDAEILADLLVRPDFMQH